MTPPPYVYEHDTSRIVATIVSKKLFCKLLNFLKDQSKRYDELNEKMSALCPGFYVNFYPHCETETLIVNFLNEQFNFSTSADSLIDYWVFDLEYGTNTTLLSSVKDGKTGESLDISTPEKLYDFLIEDIRDNNSTLRPQSATPDPTTKQKSKEAVDSRINQIPKE